MTAINTKGRVCTTEQQRNSFIGTDATAISQIYQKHVNIAIWKRTLNQRIITAAKKIIQQKPNLSLSAMIPPEDTEKVLISEIGDSQDMLSLTQDISELVEMFCYLFHLDHIGIRLAVLGNAMCPRFHVDRVPCRLITTYHGIGTQWIPNQYVDRKKLGPGSQGQPDDKSGLYQHKQQVEQLMMGEVALLKGESWIDNQGRGLVHRSPQPKSNEKRLLMTLDFSSR